MQSRVGNIRVKRGWGVIWITIKIEKNVDISHITQEMSKTKIKNKIINKEISFLS